MESAPKKIIPKSSTPGAKKPDRIKTLLLLCADKLDDACDPLSHGFLLEHKVSADECFLLCQQMAVAVRGYTQAPPDLAVKIVLCAEMTDPGERERMLGHLDRSLRQQDALKRLKAFNAKS